MKRKGQGFNAVNFVMREALFEMIHVDLCRFIPPWETNKLEFNPSYLYFIKIVPFWRYELSVFNTKHPVIIIRAIIIRRYTVIMSLHGKLNVKIFLMFTVAENTRSVNINLYMLHY